jgi:hypothetical protein
MNLSGCKNVDGGALQHFVPNPVKKWGGCITLSELYLEGCPKLTESSVRNVAHSCTKLFTLDISNCKKLGRRFVQELIDELPFVDRAHEWVGFAPKSNANELIAKRDRELLEKHSATNIQRLRRGLVARRGLHEVRMARAAIFFVPLAQAKFRGLLARRRAAKAALLRQEEQSALHMQAAFRGHLGRKEAKKRHHIKTIQGNNDHAASVIQRTYRGHMHCKITRQIRAIKQEHERQALRYEARLRMAAIQLQNAWRGHKGRGQVKIMIAAMEAKRVRAELELVSTQKIQKVIRGHWGRKCAIDRKEFLLHKAMELHSTKVIQSGYRGLQGRAELRRRKQIAQWDLEDRMVAMVQRAWRGMRGRHLTALMKSLWKLRERESFNATRIQRCWRGFLSRKLVRLVKAKIEREIMLQKCGLLIERIYRGHRGRTSWEVAFEVDKLHTTARPLFEAKEEMESLLKNLNRQIDESKAMLTADTIDEEKLTEELDMALKIKSKFHDSARITGAPQRYVTKWLQVQLAEQLKDKRDRIEVEETQLEEFATTKRELERKLRQVFRELEPLTAGVEVKTKAARTQRLRAKVRRERYNSTLIQSLFRGVRIRMAVAWGGNYWVEGFDERSQRTFWYNTWTEEKKWVLPLEVILFGDTAVAEKQAGSEWVEYFDEESGYPYYYNISTEEYRWERPEEMGGGGKATGRDWYSEQDTGKLSSRGQNTGRNIGKWVEMQDPDSGYTYYYNEDTQESRWSLSPRAAHGLRRSSKKTPRSARIAQTPRTSRWQELYAVEEASGAEADWGATAEGEQGYLAAENSSQGLLANADEQYSVWVEGLDDESKLPYWFNTVTEEYRWEKPDSARDTARATARGSASARKGPASARDWFDEQDKEKLTARGKNTGRSIGGGGWQEYLDEESGYTYYFNPATGECKWSLSPRSAAGFEGGDGILDNADSTLLLEDKKEEDEVDPETGMPIALKVCTVCTSYEVHLSHMHVYLYL